MESPQNINQPQDNVCTEKNLTRYTLPTKMTPPFALLMSKVTLVIGCVAQPCDKRTQKYLVIYQLLDETIADINFFQSRLYICRFIGIGTPFSLMFKVSTHTQWGGTMVSLCQQSWVYGVTNSPKIIRYFVEQKKSFNQHNIYIYWPLKG